MNPLHGRSDFQGQENLADICFYLKDDENPFEKGDDDALISELDDEFFEDIKGKDEPPKNLWLMGIAFCFLLAGCGTSETVHIHSGQTKRTECVYFKKNELDCVRCIFEWTDGKETSEACR